MLTLLLGLSSALAWKAVLTDPLDGPISSTRYEALMEQARAMAPAGVASIEVLARSADGELLPLDAFLPPPRPAPAKDGDRREGRPADQPGQSEGFLGGKAVYASQCHGWLWYDSLDGFSTQRPVVFDTVEDFHNPEAFDQYLMPYLENAGAAVYAAKERDLNTDMAIADNDGEGYSESGAGFLDGPAGFADQAPWDYGDDPFDAGTTRRFPADGGAVATWTPEVPEDGVYAVYLSWDSASDNSTAAHYRITHPGDVIDRTYDQTVHGSTWQYVETLWLPQGVGGLTVELVGDGTESGRYLSADAVRIGGGMGDVRRYGETTGRPRWEEAAVYYAQFNGAPDSIYDPYDDGNGSDPSARSLWAAWEHPADEDAVYLSWHSNAAGGTGTVTLVYEGSSGSATEGSDELANALQDEVVAAVRALWDPDWSDRGVVLQAFSEGSSGLNPEMPAALVELAFHDTEWDTELLKDPRFRRDAARAMYRGIVRYFAERDGVAPEFLPEPPVDVAALNTPEGVVLSWVAGPAGDPYGDAATGYRVFTSTNGYAWDNGTDVTGTEYTVPMAEGAMRYLRVAATNGGGISFPSETVAALRSGDGTAAVLLVDAFDRLDEGTLTWRDVGLGEDVVHMDVRHLGFDAVVPHADAIAALGWPFDVVGDEAMPSLEGYKLVVWIAGEESTADETFSDAQQAAVRAFVDGGGALLLTGAEILWDLDYRGDEGDQAFADEVLGVSYSSDDAGTTQADGEGLLEGLVLDFGTGDGAIYPVEYPDVLSGHGELLASYAGDQPAAFLTGKVALFGFPFETIGDLGAREAVMALLLPELVPDYTPPEVDDDPDDTGNPDTDDTGSPMPDGPPGLKVPMGEPGGCGCTGAPLPLGWRWLPLVLVAWRRRRAG